MQMYVENQNGRIRIAQEDLQKKESLQQANALKVLSLYQSNGQYK